ncbi:hypothetical protein [Echinicola salinicaeni]|uniref:hypothetical protein n=1 Tax=Echinicola salinicaeni TaxID=2762757 RepID=UPI001647C23A|nr:hypothetical protein [Echinicola salinicaeni]
MLKEINQLRYEIVERAGKPTPPFFRSLRNTGIMMATLGAVFMGAPDSLPDMVHRWGGYMSLVGAVISALCQVTVEERSEV